MWKIGFNKSKLASHSSKQRTAQDNIESRTSFARVYPAKDPKLRSEVVRGSCSKSKQHKLSSRVRTMNDEQLQKSLELSLNNFADNQSDEVLKTEERSSSHRKVYERTIQKSKYKNQANQNGFKTSIDVEGLIKNINKLHKQQVSISVGIQTQLPDKQQEIVKQPSIEKIQSNFSQKTSKISTQSLIQQHQQQVKKLNIKIQKLEKIAQIYEIKLIELASQYNTIRKNISGQLKACRLFVNNSVLEINKIFTGAKISAQEPPEEKDKNIATHRRTSSKTTNPQQRLSSILIKINEVKQMKISKTHHDPKQPK